LKLFSVNLWLVGCPFFQQDSWAKLILSNLVSLSLMIHQYTTAGMNSYRMNRINEITTAMEKPPENTKLCLSTLFLVASRINLHFN